jgi:hypothetical protein
LRPASVPVSDPPVGPPCGNPTDENERGQRPSRWRGVRGRAGFPASRRSVAACWPSPLPPCRFTVSGRGSREMPTDACSRVSVRTSAPRLHVAFGAPGSERDHQELVARASASPEHHTVLPSSDSILRGPLLRHLRRSTPGESEDPPSGRGCQATTSRSALVVSHHLGGFLRAAGPGLVASRYQTWGSLRFTFAKRRVYEAPAAGGRADPHPEGRESDRILAATTLRRFAPRRQPCRVTAADAFLPLFSSPPRPKSRGGACPEHVSPRTPSRSASRPCSADESVAPAPVSGSRRTFLPWVLIPPRPRPRSLVPAVSRGSDPSSTPRAAEADTRDGKSVRDGRRDRFRSPASRGV